MAPSSATPEQIASIGGPLLVGYLLSWALYAAVAVQVYIYYLAFPKDRLIHKLLVYGVFIIETLQAILVARDAFTSFVVGFGDFTALTDVHLTWFTMPVLSGIVAFTVQLFYAFRIFTLSKSKIIGILICLLATLGLAGALISGIEAVKVGNLTKLTSRIDHIGHGVFDITSGVCDVVIATCMALYLSRMDSGSVKSTHTVVTRIIRLIIGTGALTAAVAIIDICLYYAGTNRHKAWFLTPAVVLGRLYSNSMMVIFNSRVEIVGGRGSTHEHPDIVMSASLGSFRPSRTGDTTVNQTWDGTGTFPSSKWNDDRVPAMYPPNSIAITREKQTIVT